MDKCSTIPIVDGDRIVGIVTRTDLKNIQEQEKRNRKIEEIMTPRSKLITVRPQESVADAFMKLSKYDMGDYPSLKVNRLLELLQEAM